MLPTFLANALPPRPLPAPQFVKGDIQCADLVRFVLESEQIDTVMHFAAQVRQFGDLLGSLHGTPLQ